MWRLMKLLLRTVIIVMLVLVSSGCLQSSSSDLIQPETTQATQVDTLTTPSLAPISEQSATETAPPASTNEPETLELGQPFWIGRGQIAEAAFLPGAKQVAIAWGSGVSLYSVENRQEVWFQEVPANLIAFDIQPQGQQFAAALSDGSLVVFEAAGGASHRVEGARPNAYWGDIAWSPDGMTLAFQFIGPNRSDPIYLLDVASEQIGEVPDSQTGYGVEPVLTWSPDGSSITIASLGETCSRFVDVRTGEERMRLGEPGQCFSILALLFLPDGETVVVQRHTGELDLLRFPDGSRIRSLPGVAGETIQSPATRGFLFVDQDGQWIASRGGYEPCYCGSELDQPEYPLIVWDLVGGVIQAKLSQALESHTQRHRLATTFDGERILVFYESGEITHWAFNDPQSEETLVAQIPSRPVWPWTLSWAADGSHLAFTGRYGGVDIYETATQALIQRFDTPLDSPALSPDGRQVALFDPDQNLEAVYQVQSGRPLQSLPAAPVLMRPAFSPDGRYLTYGAGTRASVAELDSTRVTMLDPASAVPVSPEMSVTRLIWSPEGQALVTVFGPANEGSDGPGLIVLWKRLGDGSFEVLFHVANAQASYTLSNLVLAIFNPSGNRVALQSLPALEAGQAELIVYDLEARKVIQTIEGYKPAAWVNDELLLAAEAQYDTRLTRIHVTSGEKLVGSGVDLGDNAYAPGGIFTMQMTEPPERGVTIRHWQSGAVVAEGKHESLNLLDYFWSPQGDWLASIGDDGTLRLWRVVIH